MVTTILKRSYQGLIGLFLILTICQFLIYKYCAYSLSNLSHQVNISFLHQIYKNEGINVTSKKATLQMTIINATDTNSSLILEPCPNIPPNLTGRVEVMAGPKIPKMSKLEERLNWVKEGGHWLPDECESLDRVAIIIPYRARGEHLLLFLQHMHPFLRLQQLDYTIFVVEQYGIAPFNRAKLMNVGYAEAIKEYEFYCFIFHDVDLLPEDNRNLYSCPELPRHMSVAINTMKYKLPYSSLFGGVSALSKAHFELVNGFSNLFWGWGAEDDDMSHRLRAHHLTITRYRKDIARYIMLKHCSQKANPARKIVFVTSRNCQRAVTKVTRF